jgi:hypothetical protein
LKFAQNLNKILLINSSVKNYREKTLFCRNWRPTARQRSSRPMRHFLSSALAAAQSSRGPRPASRPAARPQPSDGDRTAKRAHRQNKRIPNGPQNPNLPTCSRSLSLPRPWRLGSEQGSPPPAGAMSVTGDATPRRLASSHLPLLSFSLCPQLCKNRRQLLAEMAPSPVHLPVRAFPLRVSTPPSNGLAAVPFSGGPVSGGRQ